MYCYSCCASAIADVARIDVARTAVARAAVARFAVVAVFCYGCCVLL